MASYSESDKTVQMIGNCKRSSVQLSEIDLVKSCEEVATCEKADNIQTLFLDGDDELPQDRSTFSPKPGCSKDDTLGCDIGSTPCKSRTSINVFKRGVLCSSTPLQQPPAKKHKIELSNLSAIEEIDTSDTVSENVQIKDDDEVYESKNYTQVNNNIAVTDRPPLVTNKKNGLGNLSIIQEVESSNSTNSITNTVIENIKDGECGTKSVSEECNANPIKASKDQDSVHFRNNDSILHKDEVSMIVDNIVTALERSTADNNVLDEKNLTLNVKKDLSVTYRNIEDKTIDEVILAEGIPKTKVVDIINLDHEPDREKIIEKANNLQVFVSNDEAENKDNDDPEWELLRKLETDDERYKAVRKTWKNLTIPDPKHNLSSFNWRTKNSLGPLKNTKLPEPRPENKAVSNNCYPCTEVFDVAIKKLWDFYQSRRQGLKVDHNFEHAILASLRKVPKFVTQAINSNQDSCQLTLEQLHSCLQERLDRHQKAKEEIEAIHKFYNGLKNREKNSSDLLVLKHSERQEVLDVEHMINSYSYWYKK